MVTAERAFASRAKTAEAAESYPDETVAIVRAAGLSAACTTVHGSVESGDDLFRLRRFAVFDWDMETFARRLESSFVDRE